MIGASNHNSTPRCPRCGYDQSGLIATWTASCPLEATCTECGYAFDPADAIEPTRRRLRWFYEHARSWNLRAVFTTLAVALAPPVFWRRVRPEHAVRPGRIVAWVTLLIAISVLAFSLVRWAGAELQVYYRYRIWLAAHPAAPVHAAPSLLELRNLPQALGDMVGARVNRWPVTRRIFPVSVFATGAFSLTAFVMVLCVPSQWERERVKPGHVLRVGLYSLTPAILTYWAFAAALALSWAHGAAITAWQYYTSSSPTSAFVRHPAWLSELAAGGYFTTTLVLGIAWQLLYLACALRTGLCLRSWLAVWLLAAGCGLLAAFIVAAVPLVHRWG
ncbi:MAG: hypothetical protein ACTS27_01665 [Phycisphaerales bacterium]